MKKNTHKIKKTLMTFITFSSFALSFEAFAFHKSTKEVWLEFSGTNSCEKNFCADEIPAQLLERTLNYYKLNEGTTINNFNFVSIIDFDKRSSEKRMYILNLKDGSVQKLLVTHGKKSSGKDAGYAEKFSNVEGSNMSSLGFYVTAKETYTGKHGKSIRLNGLSLSNSNARERNIVVHSAEYATQWFVDERGRLGLSEGCPAIDPAYIKEVLSKIIGESLIYIHSDSVTESDLMDNKNPIPSNSND